MSRRLVIGVGGASGAPYALRTLTALAALAPSQDLDVHVVFSRTGRLVWQDEVGLDPRSFGFQVYQPADMTPAFASGSSRFDAMAVVPCSAGGLGRIAHGLSADLIGRAADVMLKERRPLILVLREAPYGLPLLKNMVAVAEAGATILPASPSFYSNPPDREALLDTVTSRLLDHLGVPNDLMQRWTGRVPAQQESP